jgi:tRNA-2-methylthio-N6-dimethylallyladenosine synthase
VNAYHGAAPRTVGGGADEWGLGRLIRHLAEIDGLDRIRYTTSHPRDMADDLIDAHGDVPSLMPYLHLPVQSGSDKILAAMNRHHDSASYLRMVERLRARRADLALSSDFIVGFPGESEDDFAATLRLVEDVGYAQAYSFKYSARPGTPAAIMAQQVPEDVKAERLERLQALLRRQQEAFNAAMVGRILPVLFEREGRHEGQLVGRSPYLQAVHATAPGLIGEIAEVVIEALHPNSLAGRLAASVASSAAAPRAAVMSA